MLRPGVEPETPPGRGAPGAARALASRGARDRLERERAHARPGVEARDARDTRVDDGADALDGDARLRHVRREHDTFAYSRPQRAVLVFAGQLTVERQDLGGQVRQRLAYTLDLAPAGQEHEDVPLVLHRRAHRGGDADLDRAVVLAFDVRDVHREGAGVGLEQRRAEPLRDRGAVERGAHHDELQLGPRAS